MQGPAYAFDDFVVSPMELRHQSRPCPIEPRPLRLLYYVASVYPRVVSKGELLANVWADYPHVTDYALSQAVRKVRGALGDSSGSPRYLKTVPKRGFQFLCPVSSPTGKRSSQGSVEPVYTGDRSHFVRDVSYPDGSWVYVNEAFEKTWEIRNVGTVPWTGRFVSREGSSTGLGRLKSEDRVPIPDTMPGENCTITVQLQAPSMPGSTEARWKMTDAHGRLLLPNQEPVFISIDVRERPRRQEGSV